MANHLAERCHLDLLFLVDAFISVFFGTAALLTPHGIFQKILGGGKI